MLKEESEVNTKQEDEENEIKGEIHDTDSRKLGLERWPSD